MEMGSEENRDWIFNNTAIILSLCSKLMFETIHVYMITYGIILICAYDKRIHLMKIVQHIFDYSIFDYWNVINKPLTVWQSTYYLAPLIYKPDP